MNKQRATSDILSSISGVLIFLSLAYWIDLNGFTSFSPVILAAGVLILFYPNPLMKALPFGFMNQALLKTVSHILVFIGSKIYLDQYIEHFWIVYLALGIVLLNNHLKIGKTLFPKE